MMNSTIRLSALLVASWYLMLPPAQSSKSAREVPLEQWSRTATFAFDEECELAISKGCHRVRNGDLVGFEGPYCFARCVASDDARLNPR